MYQADFTNSFKKDFKKCKKRNLPLNELQFVVELILTGETLPSKYHPHKLSGNYSDHWECHIKPDWLLIYRIEEEVKEVIFIRTGSHSDLFG